MKLSVNQKCILAFIAGMLVCCMYKRYTTLEGMQLPAMLVDKKGGKQNFDKLPGML